MTGGGQDYWLPFTPRQSEKSDRGRIKAIENKNL
jgi:hypothetical protein